MADSCTDKGVGGSVWAKHSLKYSFSRGTLQTKGSEMFSRMPSESMTAVTKCKYFSLSLALSLFNVILISFFAKPLRKITSRRLCSYVVAIWLMLTLAYFIIR